MSRDFTALVASLPLEVKVAQLAGTHLPPGLGDDPGHDREALRAALPHGIGALSLVHYMSDRHVDRMRRAIDAVQAYLVEEVPGGIPALVHAEALNGLVWNGAATFPTPIGMAATFDPTWVRLSSEVAAEQAVSLGVRHALSPVLDVVRDARSGRVHETFGEDPTLVAAFGTAFVRGLQTSGDLVATGKHFLGYLMSEGALNMAEVHLGPRELREVYAYPFEAAIRDADLGTVMNSYGAIDGLPVAASRAVLTDLLRGELGFDGTVVADYGTVAHLHTDKRVAPDLLTAGIASLEAGLDLELPVALGRADLAAAVKDGRVDEAVVDVALLRLLRTKQRVGLLDRDASASPGGTRLPSRDRADDISLAAARKTLVMLQNDGVLPLREVSRLAVVGPFAESLRELFAAYSDVDALEPALALTTHTMAGVEQFITGTDLDVDAETTALLTGLNRVVDDTRIDQVIRTMHPRALTLTEGLRRAAPNGVVVEAVRGCDYLHHADKDLDRAVGAAAAADVVVVALGERTGWIGDATGGEGRTRAGLHLLGPQLELLEAVAATGTPVVVVLLSGRPLLLDRVAALASAIVVAWVPGPFGGEAIGDALFGHHDLGGRLPITFPRSTGHLPSYFGHHQGSGYRTADGEALNPYVETSTRPLFPFGHGLSYSSFRYDEAAVSLPAVPCGSELQVSVTVTCTGTCDGDTVVQLYARDHYASVTRPVRQLLGFTRLSLSPQESRRVTFVVDTAQLALWDAVGRWVVEPGAVELYLSTSSDDDVWSATVELTGDPLVLPHRRAFVASAH